jgi:hypothetical protein
MHGQISLQVKTQRPMVQVKQILQAVGKQFQGKDGVALKVLEASRTEEGDYQLRLMLDKLDSLTATPEEQVVRVRPGFVAIRGPVDIALERLHLVNAQKQRYRKEKSGHQQITGKSACTVDMLFEGKSDNGEDPTLVMLDAPRVVSLQMPFVVHSLLPPTK